MILPLLICRVLRQKTILHSITVYYFIMFNRISQFNCKGKSKKIILSRNFHSKKGLDLLARVYICALHLYCYFLALFFKKTAVALPLNKRRRDCSHRLFVIIDILVYVIRRVAGVDSVHHLHDVISLFMNLINRLRLR